MDLVRLGLMKCSLALAWSDVGIGMDKLRMIVGKCAKLQLEMVLGLGTVNVFVVGSLEKTNVGYIPFFQSKGGCLHRLWRL